MDTAETRADWINECEDSSLQLLLPSSGAFGIIPHKHASCFLFFFFRFVFLSFFFFLFVFLSFFFFLFFFFFSFFSFFFSFFFSPFFFLFFFLFFWCTLTPTGLVSRLAPLRVLTRRVSPLLSVAPNGWAVGVGFVDTACVVVRDFCVSK